MPGHEGCPVGSGQRVVGRGATAERPLTADRGSAGLTARMTPSPIAAPLPHRRLDLRLPVSTPSASAQQLSNAAIACCPHPFLCLVLPFLAVMDAYSPAHVHPAAVHSTTKAQQQQQQPQRSLLSSSSTSPLKPRGIGKDVLLSLLRRQSRQSRACTSGGAAAASPHSSASRPQPPDADPATGRRGGALAAHVPEPAGAVPARQRHRQDRRPRLRYQHHVSRRAPDAHHLPDCASSDSRHHAVRCCASPAVTCTSRTTGYRSWRTSLTCTG